MAEVMIATSIIQQFCSTSSINDVQTFHWNLSRYILYSFNSRIFPAILCLALPEIQALKQCCSFLVNFISQSRETAQANVVQTYGESLLLRVLLNLGSTAPRSSIDIFSEIFLALNKKYCDNLSRWLQTLLSQEGFPSPRISSQQKDTFMKIVLKEKANKRRLSDCVLEFSLICRGILKHDANLP